MPIDVVEPSVVAAFGAGVLSFLSPCVLPLVPGYLSLMSGLSTTAVMGAPSRIERQRLLITSLLFVLGFSVVFVAYGAIASSLGSALLEHRQVLTRIAGVAVAVMGLVVAGVFTWLPLLRERRFQVTPSALGPYAAPIMGMAFAFGWTPCIGPVLAAVLTLAAARDTLSEGVGLLGAYSLGLGVPFVLSGFAFGRLRTTWNWFRRHGRAIDRVAGGLLVIFGILLFTAQLDRLSAYVTSWWTAAGLDRLTLG